MWKRSKKKFKHQRNIFAINIKLPILASKVLRVHLHQISLSMLRQWCDDDSDTVLIAKPKCIPVGCVLSILYHIGWESPWQRPPWSGQRPPWRETSPWTETFPGQRHPLDRYPLDRGHPGQRSLQIEKPPSGQRPPWTDRCLWKSYLAPNFICRR